MTQNVQPILARFHIFCISWIRERIKGRARGLACGFLHPRRSSCLCVEHGERSVWASVTPVVFNLAHIGPRRPTEAIVSHFRSSLCGCVCARARARENVLIISIQRKASRLFLICRPPHTGKERTPPLTKQSADAKDLFDLNVFS